MKTTVGIIGLGKMGGNLALQAIEKGYTIIGMSKHHKQDLEQQHLVQVKNTKDLVTQLSSPRIVLLLLPSEKTVDEMIEEIVPLLNAGDVLADCGNSYWGDSIRRYNRIKDSGIHYIDCGTSGGIGGARNGACFMIGGDAEGGKLIEPS